MGADLILAEAVVNGVKDIFHNQGWEIEAAPPERAVAGQSRGEVVSFLTFRSSIGGTFVFNCTLAMGSVLCQHLVGNPGTDNENEMLKDAVAEVLNWISGGIKRYYAQGEKIVISTPGVFIMEGGAPPSGTGETCTLVRFYHGIHEFTMEIQVDG